MKMKNLMIKLSLAFVFVLACAFSSLSIGGLTAFAEEACEHSYVSACDTVCDLCKEEREAPLSHDYKSDDCGEVCPQCGQKREHVYDNDCDDTCNHCEEIREVPDHVYSGDCDDTCNVCDGARIPLAAHKYDNECDVDCSVCGNVREAAHAYDNACDTACNRCGVTREVEEHQYTAACDEACNVCGKLREGAAHNWANACAAACSDCGATRVVEHVFDNACDTTCNTPGCPATQTARHQWDGDACDALCLICGASKGGHTYAYACSTKCSVCQEGTRTGEGHTYDNACDKACNVCKETREVSAHVYPNGCDAQCSVCGAKNPSPVHTYDEGKENCDADCNLCGAVRTPKHDYENKCDADCPTCGATRYATHTWKDVCATECSVCGEVREAPHVYKNVCDPTCEKCGKETRPEAAHNVDPCSATCDKCGEVVNENPHTWAHPCATVCSEEGCGATRTVEHIYDNPCDPDCNNPDCDADDRSVAHEGEYDCSALCNKCGAVIEPKADHVYEKCDVSCKVCGEERNIQHTYDHACDSTCNVCGDVREIKHTPVADDENCKTALFCLTCNEVLVPAKEHTLKTETDATHHWELCEDCAYVGEKIAHEYGEWSAWSDNGDGTKTSKVACECGRERKAVISKYVVGGLEALQKEALERDVDISVIVETDSSKMDQSVVERIYNAILGSVDNDSEEAFFNPTAAWIEVVITDLTNNQKLSSIDVALEIELDFDFSKIWYGAPYGVYEDVQIFSMREYGSRPEGNYADGYLYKDSENGKLYFYTNDSGVRGMAYFSGLSMFAWIFGGCVIAFITFQVVLVLLVRRYKRHVTHQAKKLKADWAKEPYDVQFYNFD